LVDSGALVVSGCGELDDDARERMAKAMASAACSNGDEEWLERRQRPCDFGRR
jgi:hypothetical protein